MSQKSFPEPQMSRERARHPSPSSWHDFHPKLEVGQQTPSHPRSESSSLADLGHPGTRGVFPAAVWGLLFPSLSFFFFFSFLPKPDSSPAALSCVEKHKHRGGSQKQRTEPHEEMGQGSPSAAVNSLTRKRPPGTGMWPPGNRDVATGLSPAWPCSFPMPGSGSGCSRVVDAGAGMSQDVPVGFFPSLCGSAQC